MRSIRHVGLIVGAWLLLVWAGTAQAAISEVGSQRNTQGGPAATTVTFNYGATPTQGNLLVATFSYRLSGTTINSTPSGWQLAKETRQSAINTAIYWKIAGASEPTQAQWGLSASVKSAGTATEWSSTNGWPASPVNGTPGGNGADTGTTGLSSGSTTTTGTVEKLLIAVHGCNRDNTFSNWTNSFTCAATCNISSTGGPASTRNTAAMAHRIVTSNATYNTAADQSASNNWAAAIAAFIENVASTTTTTSTSTTTTSTSTTTTTVSAVPKRVFYY